MKALMIDVVDRCYDFLSLMFLMGKEAMPSAGTPVVCQNRKSQINRDTFTDEAEIWCRRPVPFSLRCSSKLRRIP
jgi:hypothetical protein